MKKRNLSIASALMLAFILVVQTVSPTIAYAEELNYYSTKNQLTNVNGNNISHLSDDGIVGSTQYSDENINFEGFYGLKVHCENTAVNYTMYSHTDMCMSGDVKVRYLTSEFVNLGNISKDETKSFNLTDIINKIKPDNPIGLYQLVLVTKIDMINNQTVNLYYDGTKVQTCWLTKQDKYDIDNWNTLVANIDPGKCLNMWVGNKNNLITYPTSGTNGNCNHVKEWCDLSDEIITKKEWSDEFKVFLIVCYLSRNFAYDDYRVYTLDNASRASEAGTWSDDNLFMFYNHVGQCWDFANALTIMCRHQGIPCTSVENRVHTVNAVWLNGEWVAVDVSTLVAHHCNTKDTDPSKWVNERNETYGQAFGYYDGNMSSYSQALATPETTLSGRSGRNPI